MSESRRKPSRFGLSAAGALALGAFLGYAFWPRAAAVDMVPVVRGGLVVTIDEEARTRVRDAYVVSAPVSGKLLRTEVHSGDDVTQGETVVARMLPAAPSPLDVRTEEQARAAISSAEAALDLARAEVRRSQADLDFTHGELDRTRTLRREGAVAQAALDRSQRAWRSAVATLETATAAVAMREADLVRARTALLPFARSEEAAAAEAESHVIALMAPVSGQILRVMRESETVLAPGEPILEIGDPAHDLEIVTELLSADAVKVEDGACVMIDNWGGLEVLEGRVARVEPWGFTKVSALGVEEQRVNVVIDFVSPAERRAALGHGYRVETRIVVHESEDVLLAPASALFRDGDTWRVFRVDGRGRARGTTIERGRSNGTMVEIVAGLAEGDRVVVYPSAALADGGRVKQRTAG